MEKDRPDLRKPVHVCERKIKDCYKKLNILTQEVADCNLKIDEHHKRKNTKLDFANEYRIQRKNLEQKAECFGCKADSFCLKKLMSIIKGETQSWILQMKIELKGRKWNRKLNV